MMFLRWSLRILGTALLFITGLLPMAAQSRGYSPDRLQQLDQIGHPPQIQAKELQREAMSAYVNTEADYLNPAFWNAPPFEDSSVSFNWPKSWKAEDRQGDTRLKYNRLLAKWNPQHDGTGTDHFYLRFDLKRAVTNATEFTSQGQGHLGDALYTKMTGGGLLSDKTKVRIMLSVAYAKPDYMSGTVPVHLHDLTYDLVIVDINGAPLNILDPGRQYGDHVLPIDFTVPTSALRFPVKGDPEPTPAWNVVHFKLVPPKVRSPRFYIPGGYLDIPATFIQYSFTMDAELTFGAIAPIFLVHGTNADHTTWEAPSGSSFVDYFNPTSSSGYGYLGTWDYHIDLSTKTGGNGSIEDSGIELKKEITDLMKSLGARACHLIAHSKGGSDSRRCIAKIQMDLDNPEIIEKNKFRILSLYSIGTPHKGTVLADISYAQAMSPIPDGGTSSSYDIRHLMDGNSLAAFFGAGPRGDARKDQQTSEMMKWYNDDNTSKYLNGQFYSIIADADINNDRTIDSNEGRVLLDWVSLLKPSLGTWMYRTLGWVRSIQTTPRIVDFGTPVLVVDIEPKGDWTFIPNDIVGTVTSAVGPNSVRFLIAPFSVQKISFENNYMAQNHSTMKNFELANQIVQDIVNKFSASNP